MRFLRRLDATTTVPPERLLAELRVAYEANDSAKLLELCRSNQAAILAAFPGWWPPNPGVVADPVELDAYTQAVGSNGKTNSGSRGAAKRATIRKAADLPYYHEGEDEREAEAEEALA